MWWTPQGLNLLKQIKPINYSKELVILLNAFRELQLSTLLLLALNEKKIPSEMWHIDDLTQRGMFLEFIKDNGLSNEAKQLLEQLNPVWRNKRYIDLIKKLSIRPSSETVINFLNAIMHSDLDDYVLKGLEYRLDTENIQDYDLCLWRLRQDGLNEDIRHEITTLRERLQALSQSKFMTWSLFSRNKEICETLTTALEILHKCPKALEHAKIIIHIAKGLIDREGESFRFFTNHHELKPFSESIEALLSKIDCRIEPKPHFKLRAGVHAESLSFTI